MIAFSRSMLRRLAGPRGRRSFAVLLLAGLWAWWLWTPPRPVVEWELPTGPHHQFIFLPDGRSLIEFPTGQVENGWGRTGPVVFREMATGEERLRLFADDLRA